MLPTDPTQADPSIVALMHGMKVQEGTNCDYSKQGDKDANGNCTAAGIAQWSNQDSQGKVMPLQQGQIPTNFQTAASQYGLDSTDFSPENQNKVLYSEIATGKKAGLTPEQILSKHNSGDPNKYLSTEASGTGQVGTYDVSTYVKNAMQAAQKYAQQNKQSTGQNGLPSASQASQTQNQPQQSSSNSDNTYGAIMPYTGSDPNDSPIVQGLKAGAQAAVNLPSSAWHFISSIGSALLHPINTGEGLVNAIRGGLEEGYSKLSGGQAPDDKQSQTFDAVINSLKDRYGGLDNLSKTAVNDPFGFGTDIVTAISGIGEGLDALSGASKVNSAIEAASRSGATAEELASVPEKGGVMESLKNVGSKVASPITTPAGAIAKGGYNVGTGLVGKALGVEGGAVRTAVSSALDGGNAYKSFVQGLSGNSSQEDLVNEARSALGEVVDKRSSNYQDMLSSLKGDSSTYDISPISKQFDSQLQKFGITRSPDGSLDFSRSTISDSSDINKINQINSDLKSWGTQAGDRTAMGIDTLKRRISNYYSPSSDFRAMTQAIGGATRDVLKQAPGYTKEMADYSDMTDQISDIKKGLSLGDNASVETTFKKLTSAFRQNNGFRQQLIRELDQATGGNILSKVAGQQMSSYMPRGLIGTLEAGGLSFSALSGGTGVVPLLFTMAATSPKLVGTFIRSLRLPAAISQKIMGILGRVGTTGLVASDVASKNGLMTPPNHNGDKYQD